MAQEALLENYDQVLRNIGSTSAKVLRARRLFVNKQFDRAVILSKMKADSLTGEVPKELVAEVEKLTKERNELSKQLEQAHKQYGEEYDKLRKLTEQAQVKAHARGTGKAPVKQTASENKNMGRQ